MPLPYEGVVQRSNAPPSFAKMPRLGFPGRVGDAGSRRQSGEGDDVWTEMSLVRAGAAVELQRWVYMEI